ncbi:DDE-type integrase/transposase/recombinase [Bacillus albus]|nr:DDE-type integrase/transposase/recombinase [Bacillus albus]
MDKRIRHDLKQPNAPYRVDETYIKFKKQWMYLYFVADSEENTIDFYLSKSRYKQPNDLYLKDELMCRLFV